MLPPRALAEAFYDEAWTRCETAAPQKRQLGVIEFARTENIEVID